MKRAKVSIPWREGMHLRPTTKLVQRAMTFRSSVFLRLGERIADAKSILAVMLLCGTFGSVVELEASGPDEEEALSSITAVFDPDESEENEESEENRKNERKSKI